MIPLLSQCPYTLKPGINNVSTAVLCSQLVVSVLSPPHRSAVMVIWTVVVYACLILHRPATSLLPSSTALGFRGDPKSYSEQSPMPVEHVYYLKTHKTASTTIYCILAEYCRSHQLLALLPSQIHINLMAPFHPSQVMLEGNISRYDMVFNHHVYDEHIFRYLHNDTFTFTTIREPFRHFISSFTYFRDMEHFRYLRRINTSNPLETFLSNPNKYEVRRYSSFTNNRQSIDLGFNLTHTFDDLSYIRHFIRQTEERFDLILITDYFHESLILLKRTLHWATQDILYYKKLARKQQLNISKETLERYRQQHKNFSTADIQLYDHFLPLFKEKISAERGLLEEVKELEAVLEKVHTFCDRPHARDKQLFIPAGKWSSEINILYSKCKWLQLDEISFTKHLKTVRKFILGKRSKKDHVSTTANIT